MKSVCASDRKSTRLNSSHLVISYAVFCLKKKNTLWLRPAVLWLVSTSIGYVIWVVAGWETTDQIGFACKLIELVALGLTMRLFFFNDPATTEIYTLSLHDALPILRGLSGRVLSSDDRDAIGSEPCQDRKSTRLNSSHLVISYAVFCLKKKKKR